MQTQLRLLPTEAAHTIYSNDLSEKFRAIFESTETADAADEISISRCDDEIDVRVNY